VLEPLGVCQGVWVGEAEGEKHLQVERNGDRVLGLWCDAKGSHGASDVSLPDIMGGAFSQHS